METVEVVIRIPKDDIETIKKLKVQGFASRHEIAILNGTVLPKGHGRLIDADALEIKNLASSVSHTNIWGVAPLDIDIAPTIIEADKDGQDGR